MPIETDVLIIGCGIAGATAAIRMAQDSGIRSICAHALAGNNQPVGIDAEPVDVLIQQGIHILLLGVAGPSAATDALRAEDDKIIQQRIVVFNPARYWKAGSYTKGVR